MAYSNNTTMDSFQTTVSSPVKTSTTFLEFIVECDSAGPCPMRAVLQTVLLIAVLPTNLLLLYLFLKNRKILTPSEILGLNFAVLSVIYSLSLPMDIMISLKSRSGLLMSISNTFNVLSYTGCPLLLTCMCVERYVAVSLPVLFMKLGKWQYRAAISAVIWIVTSIMAVFTFIYSIGVTAIVMSIIVNLLFFIMVGCLLKIVWVLHKKGPGDEKSGEKNDSPMKRRAVKNIMAVMIPSGITYCPLLGLVPFIYIIQNLGIRGTSPELCTLLQVFGVLPNFGTCIGPVFYMSRIKKSFCGEN